MWVADCGRLNEAVSAWWRCYPDCRIPVNMKLPVLAEEVKANVHGVRVISCSPGTVLLSCGLDNVDTTGHWDVDRYSHIITTGHCDVDRYSHIITRRQV